jgi:ABC-type polysaccharide/polyol phosphate transport system ATPase subunit
VTASVSVRGVSRHFRLYHERYHTMKERALRFGKIPYDDFWALRDVSLEIEEGSTFGLIGANGSGKSTLLKCIAGILRPSEGEIQVRGRLAALLELGAGFQGELTGRENIFLNGSLLGLSQRELARRYDEIVAFSELEQFIDTQVRFYSSGMYVRLGFAIAVNVDPDILVLDEVLAVGDEAFQRKCLERIRQFQREGRTIVMVSHAVESVRQICDAAGVLDGGVLVASGRPGEAIRTYREHLLDRARVRQDLEAANQSDDEALAFLTDQERRRTLQVRIIGSRLEHLSGGARGHLLPDAGIKIHVSFESQLTTDDVNFGIAINDQEGRLVFGSNTRLLDHPIEVREGPGEAVFRLDRIPLLDGSYTVTLGITSYDEGVVYDWREEHLHFEVMNPGGSVGYANIPIEVEVLSSPVREVAP